MEKKVLFDNLKSCKVCQRSLPMDYEADMCAICAENELFSRVRDFIRSKDVTEYQVAEEFDIPLRKVKNWIREGRIEYKDTNLKVVHSLHCIVCGDPISFGSYCQKCYKIKHSAKATILQKKEDEKMRFLE